MLADRAHVVTGVVVEMDNVVTAVSNRLPWPWASPLLFNRDVIDVPERNVWTHVVHKCRHR